MAGIEIPAEAFNAIKSGQPIPEHVAPGAKPQEQKTVGKSSEGGHSVPQYDDAKKEAQAKDQQRFQNESSKAAEKKIWKLKDGDNEFEYDASDEEALKRDISKARAADRRFQEAAQLRKEVMDRIEAYEREKSQLSDKSKLDEVLKKFGHDPEKWAEEYIWQKMQLANMSEEERAHYERDQELENYRTEAKTRKEREEIEAREARIAEKEQEVEQTVIEALKSSGAPVNYNTAAKMAFNMRSALEAGIDATPQQLAQFVHEESKNEFASTADSLSDEQLESWLGEKNLARIRNWELKKIKTPTDNPFQRKEYPGEYSENEPPKRKKLAADEWAKDLRAGFLAQFGG